MWQRIIERSQSIFQQMKPHGPVLWVMLFSICIFLPSLNNFFAGDDWFHLKVIQIDTFREFLNFFNPVFNEQSTAFYRPIPNQLFFFVFYRLFGLWAFPYYLFLLSLFAFSILLLHSVLLRLGFRKHLAVISTFIYAFSHTHFAQLNFLSAGQEIMMSVFFLLGMRSSLSLPNTRQQTIQTSVFFFLALLCKENALVLPVFILVTDWLLKKRIIWPKMLILAATALAYLFLRFGVYHSPLTDIPAYELNFSPKLALNTLYFYGIWAVGAPEMLQDYLASPVRVIDRFSVDFPVVGQFLLAELVSVIAVLTALFLWAKEKWRPLLAAFLFVASLGPILFLPYHKYAIQTSIPMMCFAVFVGLLLKNRSPALKIAVVSLLLALNLTSIAVTEQTHYTVQRSTISQRVYDFFVKHYERNPNNAYFVFMNANTPGSELPAWGSSQQVSYALWGSFFAQVFYKDFSVLTYFEDIPFDPPEGKVAIPLSSEPFLR